jgi:alpha-amylase/alpha-mannosidase (GH57 family)
MQKNSNKYVCIHGHFYQPPRENAWLEQIEVQESASPFHDWNERINDECYAPNAHARILNENGRIIDITNNYEKISFNMGPTLLSWMELNRPDTYQSILDADASSQKLFNGHGSAVAQVYNHLIMPLASKRDKETQIYWGLYDFEKRFKRTSEGIWLAETAVDTETLQCLADQGVKYTILAPNQAKRFRGTHDWKDGINPNIPYIVDLGNNRQMTLFFYNSEISQEIAFNGLLNDGKQLANSLLKGFEKNVPTPEILNVATDGESYGHHHRQGEMALAYCLHHLETSSDAQLANYGYFLSKHEPIHEVEIHENSSWSCAHGVERWKSNCGCHTGGEEGWNQEWRVALRDSLDWLKTKLDELFISEMSTLHPDPWQLRNQFIEVVFQIEERDYPSFLKKYLPELTGDNVTRAIRMLEMQRNGMLMFTSCGWFFNDVSGIETIQILQYANRAIQLAERESGLELEAEFMNLLDQGRSNIEEMGSIKDIYLNHVSNKRMSLSRVGMHYAVHVLFAENPETLQVFNYNIETSDLIRFSGGQQILCMGRAVVNSKVTLSVKHLSFAVLYLGNHHIIGGTSDDYDEGSFRILVSSLEANFKKSHITSVIYDLEKHFPKTHFSFFDLMKDEQKKILNEVIDNNVADASSSINRISKQNYTLLNLMKQQGLAVPHVLWQTIVTKLEYDLRETLLKWGKTGEMEDLFEILNEFNHWHIVPNANFEFKITKALKKVIDAEHAYPDQISELLDRLSTLGMDIELIDLQNFVFRKLKNRSNGDWKLLGDKIQLEL